MLRFAKLTVRAQEASQEAQEVAARHNQEAIEPLHMLAAHVDQGDGVVPPLLSRLGVPPEVLSRETAAGLETLARVTGISQHHVAPATNEVLKQAFDEADRFKDEYVSTDHLILAIAGLRRDPAANLLKRQGASHGAILQALTSIRGSHRITSATPESIYRALEQHTRGLTDCARRGKLEPLSSAMRKSAVSCRFWRAA